MTQPVNFPRVPPQHQRFLPEGFHYAQCTGCKIVGVSRGTGAEDSDPCNVCGHSANYATCANCGDVATVAQTKAHRNGDNCRACGEWVCETCFGTDDYCRACDFMRRHDIAPKGRVCTPVEAVHAATRHDILGDENGITVAPGWRGGFCAWSGSAQKSSTDTVNIYVDASELHTNAPYLQTVRFALNRKQEPSPCTVTLSTELFSTLPRALQVGVVAEMLLELRIHPVSWWHIRGTHSTRQPPRMQKVVQGMPERAAESILRRYRPAELLQEVADDPFIAAALLSCCEGSRGKRPEKELIRVVVHDPRAAARLLRARPDIKDRRLVLAAAGLPVPRASAVEMQR